MVDAETRIWNEVVGGAWVEHADAFDATLEPFGECAMDGLGLHAGMRVLDVGCGAGATTVRLASRVHPAAVTGVDLSTPMLAAARRRAETVGATNVEFVEADIQTSPLGSEQFDVAFSRFGVMFFADPVAAFANVRAALVEGGRFAFVCFQGPSANPFIAVPVLAAAQHLEVPAPPGPGEPGPFSLADADHVASLLEASGFHGITVEPGPTEATLGRTEDLTLVAARALAQNPSVALALEGATAGAAAAAVAAAAEALGAHDHDGVIRLPAATWIVNAEG